ncbi:hypothetical protein V3C99_012024 [Haemonchus contortus]
MLREQLASLPSNNAMDFLANVRKTIIALQIAREVDGEATVVSEDLAAIEEVYLQILASLQSYKRDLLTLKEETCMLCKQYRNFVTSFMDAIQKDHPELIPQLKALSRKQVLLQRLKWSNCARELLSSCRMEMNSNNCDWSRLSECFGKACKLAQEHIELTDNSRATFTDGLRELAQDLNEFARTRLDEVFCAIKYPFENVVDTRAYVNEVKTIASILSLIYLITEYLQEGTGYQEIYRVLLLPFGKRFIFHFCEDRKTSDVWKPQWYLSQTLNWMQANLAFFVSTIGSVFEPSGPPKSPEFAFYKYLSELPIAKTGKLLKQEMVLNDVLLFSHLLDECLSYESQLRDIDPDGYSSSILTLFCDQDVLNRWIEIENECCLDRMDEMLSAPDRWQSRFRFMEEADQYSVCNCVDAFVSMVQSLRSRAKLLPDKVAQRKFLHLQLFLTDDFRKRLVQIANQAESPWSEPFPNVMNAIWYLRHVVEEWSDSCLLNEFTSSSGRAVFEESSAMFKHVWNQMAEDVVTSLRLQTIDAMKPYQQHFWCFMEPRLGSSSRDLTALFCPVLMKIRTTFAKTGVQISKASLEELFKRMSAALASAITTEIVDVTPFSAEGATQMLFDMENGLIPLISHIFTRCGVSPNMNYDEAFVTLLGSLKLLSLPWAVITLMRDEIDQLPDEVADEKLFEMKIYGVNKGRAKNLIRLRSDIDQKGDAFR